MSKTKLALKYLLGIFFIGAGVNHFVHTQFYMNIMPPYLPWPLSFVYVSGILEAGFGALVLIPRFTTLAAWGLILVMTGVFPANIHMALHPDQYPNIRPLVLWLRLPLQILFIAWPLWYARAARPNDAPARSR
jgi:uncharacterized membrane protein